jgi:3-hydroxy-3-methylglutaryl CoA synthase
MSLEAMKQALDALETHGAPLLNHEDAYSASLTALRQAIAEVEKQEPDELTIAYMSGFFNGKKKREWVGLTDEEAMQTWEGIIKYAPSEMRIKDFAKAVEDKLREKNG